MKVTLDLPDFKFPAGSVVKKGELIVHVESCWATGYFRVTDNKSVVQPEQAYYDTTVQEGTGLVQNPIRPGTFLSFDKDEMESAAKIIEWGKPIVSPDTQENISQRWKEWKA